MNIRGWNIQVVQTTLPWGGDGCDLDLIASGLRAYHETRRGASDGAKRDIDAWNRGCWS